MDRLGFIHEKLDIKILILFILRRLPDFVSFEKLSELVMVDDGFDYFEFTQCLSELVDSGNILQMDTRYKITKTGAVHAETVENSIPFSVRTKAERSAQPVIERMRRDALIGTSHETLPNGGSVVKLSLSDGVGDVISLSLLSSGEEQAESMEKYFRENAETLYHKFVEILTPDIIKGDSK